MLKFRYLDKCVRGQCEPKKITKKGDWGLKECVNKKLHFVTVVSLKEPLELRCECLGFVERAGGRSDAS